MSNLLADNETNFRNYGDHYELVVSPSKDLPIDDIRHAFLHFLLDPIAIRYRVNASRLSRCLNMPRARPCFRRKCMTIFPPFFDECLVRAVEFRLRRLSPEDLASAIDQAESSGYVLVRPIYAGLAGF